MTSEDRSYEAPALEVLSSVEEITFGGSLRTISLDEFLYLTL